jgi:hypothetical protein
MMVLLRSNTARSIAALGVAAAVTAGCGDDPVAPPAISGTWVLASVSGDGLPKVIATSANATTSITAGRLDFRSRGRVLDIQTYHVVTNFGAQDVGPDTVAVAYEFSGNQLILKRTYIGGRTFSDTGEVDLEAGGMLIKARDVGPAHDVNFQLLYYRI